MGQESLDFWLFLSFSIDLFAPYLGLKTPFSVYRPFH